jgi:hypothetical protein
MTIPVKMLLKIRKMTLGCPKQLPSNEYTGDLDFPAVKGPASLHSPVVMNSPWCLDLLVYLEQASELVYRKINS